jgi:hypothetical protein
VRPISSSHASKSSWVHKMTQARRRQERRLRPCEGGGHGADCSDSPRRCEWRPAPCVCATKGKRGGLRRLRGHGTLQSVEAIFLGGCVSRLACVRALVNPMASDMLKKILLLKVVRDDCDDQIACSHLRVRAVRLCAVSEQRAEWSEPIKCVQFNQGNPLKTKKCRQKQHRTRVARMRAHARKIDRSVAVVSPSCRRSSPASKAYSHCPCCGLSVRLAEDPACRSHSSW